MSFKIFLNQAQHPIEIRRITVSNPPPTWSQFKEILAQLFPTHFNTEMLIHYEDDEKELICIHSQVEWAEALNVLQSLKIKKIFLSTSKEVKVTPPPEEQLETIQIPQEKHDEQVPEITSSSSLTSSTSPPNPSEFNSENQTTVSFATTRESFHKFAESIPLLLDNIFNGKGTPFELPQWLKDAIEKAKKEGQELNLEKHYHEFVNRGLEFLNHDIYDNGKKAFEKLLALKDKHPEMLKNLVSEVEVMKVDAQNAFNHIQLSMQTGINHVSTIIQSDPDFQDLKAKPEFGSFVEFVKKKIGVPTTDPARNVVSEIVNEPELPEFPPRIDQVPVSDPLVERNYDTQIAILTSMGFMNVDVNKVLLEDANGNLDQVISILLDGPTV